MSDIIIIGSGLAGYTLAREIRKHDAAVSVTVITANDGAAYSKPMLSNALSQGKDPIALVQKTAADASAEHNITIRPHTHATAIDRDARTLALRIGEDRERLSFGKLILALGAAPRPYAVPGAGNGVLQSINSLDDYRIWRSDLNDGDRVLVVGGGLIGIEFANDLAQSGHAVTVVEPAPHPLGRLLPDGLGPMVADALRQAGVSLELGHTLQSVVGDGGGHVATLDSGKRVAFNKGLVAIGLVPHTALAASAGLDTDAGIVVDETLRTTDPDIFAIGDCAQTPVGVLPFVLPLMAEARALAKTLTGRETPLHLPALPVTVKTPALPLVVCPPPANAQGQWAVEGSGIDRRALFIGPDGRNLGFALTGSATKERMALAKTLPDLLAA